MSTSYLAFGGMVAVGVIAVVMGIRFHFITVWQAAVVMALVPLAAQIAIALVSGGDMTEAVCTGALMSVGFGGGAYVFGRALEQSSRK